MHTRTRALRAAAGCALALAATGCAGGLANVGVRPAASQPQPGRVETAVPKPSATAQNCDPLASARPNGAAGAGASVQRIRARGKLVVGVSQDGYLTGYLDASGNESGFDVDIARQVEKALFGTEDAAHIQYKAVTNAERITDLADGSVDLVSDTFTMNCERETQIAFSTEYYAASQRLLVLKGSPYRSLDDLGGKKVCAQADSTSIAAIAANRSHPVPYGVTNLTDCLVALQENLVDAISTDDTILAGLGKQDQNTVVVGPAIEAEPYGIGVAKNAPDLVAFVNGVLEQIRADGTWQSLYAQWLQPYLGAAQPLDVRYSG